MNPGPRCVRLMEKSGGRKFRATVPLMRGRAQIQNDKKGRKLVRDFQDFQDLWSFFSMGTRFNLWIIFYFAEIFRGIWYSGRRQDRTGSDREGYHISAVLIKSESDSQGAKGLKTPQIPTDKILSKYYTRLNRTALGLNKPCIKGQSNEVVCLWFFHEWFKPFIGIWRLFEFGFDFAEIFVIFINSLLLFPAESWYCPYCLIQRVATPRIVQGGSYYCLNFLQKRWAGV